MSEHKAQVVWERGGKAFTYEAYSRDHRITFEGGVAVAASAAVDFLGNRSLPNPEDELVAALSSCHMLTFLAIAAKRGIVVERYEDDATGTLAKNAEGRLALTTCVLRPRVQFGHDAKVDGPGLAKLHEQAHRGCFIATSVKTEVTVDLGAGIGAP